MNSRVGIKFLSKLKKKIMKKIVFSFLAALYGSVLLAQETKDVNINLNTKGGGSNWYASPWIWVVGAAVFILLLVALMRGGGRKD